MPTQIFINLPVHDLDAAMAFFRELEFRFNPQFTNDKGACMVVEENIFVMLLTEAFFQTFTKKSICDASVSTEVLLCLSRDSRAAVDEMVRKAVAAGGRIPREPEDHGFMYGHAFEDLDGHTWELAYMEPQAQGEQGP